MKKIVNVAIYCRTALKDQEAITNQENRLMRICDKQGYNIVAIYTDDGYSANNLNRPALQQMLKDIKKPKIQYNRDR